MKVRSLTEGGVIKTLFMFAVPFLIANILQSLYGAVDLFVIGQFCSYESSAAVSTGTQVTQIITSLITGLTLGSTIIIGQFKGAKDENRIKQTIGTTFTVFAIAAIVLTLLMLVFMRPLLTLLQTPAESFELTAQYVSICMYGNIFVCGYNAVSAVLRGLGDSTRPMIFVGIAGALNIALDFLFTGALGMDVSGTALATIVSQGLSMIISIIYLKRKDFIFDFRLRSFKPVGGILKRLAAVGIPISSQELMVRISFLYMTAVMNSCGVFAATVVGIGAKYDVFAMLSATSMANALAAITAQNYGANKPERAKKSLWAGLCFTVIYAVIFWAWAQLSPESMISAFNADPNVVAAGVPYFRSCSYDYILVSIVFTLNGYLNGRQKTLWTMISVCAGALLLRIPLVYFFSNAFSENLGMLGMIAPTVSGIMAVYTLVYVIVCDRKKLSAKNNPSE